MKFFERKKKHQSAKKIPKKRQPTRHSTVKALPARQPGKWSLEDSIRQIKQEAQDLTENAQNGVEKFTAELSKLLGDSVELKHEVKESAEELSSREPPKQQARHKSRSKEKSIPKNDPGKDFLKTFKQLTYSHRAWDIWRDFIVMLACAMSNSVDKAHYDKREKLYLSTIKRYQKSEQQLFPELVVQLVLEMEKNPEQDFLGKTFMELDLGSQDNGQFFTPYYICEFMAKVAANDVVQRVEKDGYITIYDPCCGAGATLIAGVHEVKRQLEKVNLNFQNHVLVVAQDIDETVALMCYIQLSLLGVAGYVKVGNTFTDPIATGDSLENYWFTPMYFSNVWSIRRLFHKTDDLSKGEHYENI